MASVFHASPCEDERGRAGGTCGGDARGIVSILEEEGQPVTCRLKRMDTRPHRQGRHRGGEEGGVRLDSSRNRPHRAGFSSLQ